MNCASDRVAHGAGLGLGPTRHGLGHGVAGLEGAALPALPVLQEKTLRFSLGQPFP